MTQQTGYESNEVRSLYGRRKESASLNLGSNELRHPGLVEVYSEINLQSSSNYPTPNAYPVHQLAVEAVSEFVGRKPSEVLIAPGSDPAIRAFVAVNSSRGLHRIVLPEPAYPAWREAAKLFNVAVHSVRLSGDATTDTCRLLEALEGSPALLALTWPNAPIAHGDIDTSQISLLQERCRSLGGDLVLDLCYAPFYTDTSRVKQLAKGTTVFFSGSKAFGLAGARAAIVAGPKQDLRLLAAAGIENAVSQNALNLLAGCLNKISTFEHIWDDIRARRNYLRQKLISKGFTVPVSNANFLHVAFPSADTAEAVAESMYTDQIRMKANTALSWMPSVRFAVTVEEASDHAVDLLIQHGKEKHN